MTSYSVVDLGLNKRQRPACGELFTVVVCDGMRHLVPAVRSHRWRDDGHNRWNWEVLERYVGGTGESKSRLWLKEFASERIRYLGLGLERRN